MDFDFNELMADMASAFKSRLGEDWPQAKNTVVSFMESRKERLKLLTELRLEGEISQERFLSRLSDEKEMAEAELNTVTIISKVMAQKAANAAFEVVEKAIQAIINKAI